MTRDEKLALHLEMVVWSDLPEGTRLNAQKIGALVSQATDDQRQRAYERALVTCPLLLEDERIF